MKTNFQFNKTSHQEEYNRKKSEPSSQNSSRIEDLNSFQQPSQQEVQDNSQIEYLNNSLSNSQQLPQQQQSLLKSIYQLFNMYVVEYVDGSGNTIKMHFNQEEYKRIFVQTGGCYPASYDATTKRFTLNSNDPSSDNKKINPDTFLTDYFDTENATLKPEKAASCLVEKPLYYYSTKETPSTKQQKQDGDIPEKIEVNFNIPSWSSFCMTSQ